MNTVIIPTIGKFHVAIKPTYTSRDSSDIMLYSISIGDYNKKCVFITAYTDKNKTALKLSWLESGNCTIDNLSEVKGNSTVIMILLAITIAREVAPHATHIILQDMSNLTCKSNKGDTKLPLAPYYIAFHGKTWYEDKFGAVMDRKDERDIYNESIKKLDDPSAKPEVFNNLTTINNGLNDILISIYNTTRTWREFFARIDKKYRITKCWLVHPIIIDVMDMIFDGRKVYNGSTWRIDINDINTPKINYYEIKEDMKGGGKEYVFPPYPNYVYGGVLVPEVDKCNYMKFIKKYPNRRTRRVKKV